MMETNKSTDEIEINLGEIFALLLHKVWIIILAAVVCGAVGFLYSYFLITPQYQSTTKVYILNKQNSTSVTYSDVQLSTTLSKDYEQLVTSRYVIEGVIKQLNLDETYESLVEKVSATNTDDTRIIAITVINPDPEQAQKVANAVRDLAAQHITQVMDIEAVNVVDSANLPTSPVSPSVPTETFTLNLWRFPLILTEIYVSPAFLAIIYPVLLILTTEEFPLVHPEVLAARSCIWLGVICLTCPACIERRFLPRFVSFPILICYPR